MATIHIIKNLCKWTLIAMLSYHTFLGIRDSDRLTFENRFREAPKFLEQNSKEYREVIDGTLDKNKKNWDGTCCDQTIAVMRDICPIVVLAHAQVGSILSVFLVLNSRIGCFGAIIHGIFLAVSANFIHFRQIILKLLNATPNEFLGSDTEAFGPEFFDKQKTWKCGLGYAVGEIVLALVVWVLITL